jgi:hypothetical protein
MIEKEERKITVINDWIQNIHINGHNTCQSNKNGNMNFAEYNDLNCHSGRRLRCIFLNVQIRQSMICQLMNLQVIHHDTTLKIQQWKFHIWIILKTPLMAITRQLWLKQLVSPP